ncbi:MAG: 50S ribosomal protein L5 [Bacteroidia bacterium]|nr:50S ribosomal protein L5 [Bacteroidia bacterium]
MAYIIRLKKDYTERIAGELKTQFSYKNIMQIPRIEKVVLSRGMGKAVADKKLIEHSVNEIAQIAGQKPIICRSKKDISNFKLRAGVPIGCKVTLRGDKMYEFLDRLINISLPRTRDFRGLQSKGFDGRGNYNLGIREQIIFPEIDVDKIYEIMGMDITIVTTAKTDAEAYALLKAFGMPFKENK